jgi:type I restriction enzyme M protein
LRWTASSTGGVASKGATPEGVHDLIGGLAEWTASLYRPYGDPPPGNANFAWVQHIVHHLAPAGVAGFVLSNGSMSSNQSGEGEIRKALVEADLVDCMVALPGQLFYSTQIPACLWFLARDRRNGKFRDRCGHVLFIDARKLGVMVDRTHRDLTDAEIARIAGTYHLWRGEKDVPPAAVDGRTGYEDIPGFCKSAALDDIRKHGHVLTPGRYVGAEAAAEEEEPFAEKMARLVADLRAHQAEAAKLDAAIAANLKEVGYGE